MDNLNLLIIYIPAAQYCISEMGCKTINEQDTRLFQICREFSRKQTKFHCGNYGIMDS